MNDHVDILEGVTGSSPWRFQPPASTVLLTPVSSPSPPTLESILQPNKEVSPYLRTWVITMKNGKFYWKDKDLIDHLITITKVQGR